MSDDGGRVVIVGASAAGLRCAARLRRLQPKRPITVVEQSAVFSVAACGMPYVLSGDIPNADALRKTGDGALRDAHYFEAVKGIEVLAETRAEAVDAAGRTLRVSGAAGERELPWDQLVLATGGRARKLPGQPEHPRVRAFHCFEDIAPLAEGLKKGDIERAVVVGAGLVGCELAEAFKSLWDAEVCLIEAGGWPLPQILDAEAGAVVAHELVRNEVELHCGAPVDGIAADDEGVTVSAGGASHRGDVVVVAFGVEPAVELARSAELRLGPTGAIAVDDRLATSVPGIFAAGDCIEVNHAVTGQPAYRPLGSLANRQGRTLANVLAGRDDRFGPVAGAGAIKIFDLNVACTGVPLDAARRDFPSAAAVWTSPSDSAHYWPESKNLHLQLVYDADSRRVLGIQAVGPGECAKRVDVAAQLLLRGADLAAFTQLEHAYAPPYAPAIEPLAQVAMVAEDALDGVEAIPPGSDLEAAPLLDVRHPEEWEQFPVPVDDVKCIDQLELRGRLDELGHGPWTLICARGARSAEVVRMLRQRGVDARYVGGGMLWLRSSGRAGDG
jgi:NADPH-dependent 2,4-dienoyl-CoA reductase/sulfur reductase-like enzyme/rhodanese-related sulfurtransferase